MALYDLTEFLRLSAVINYNLSAASLNPYNILKFILGGKSFHPDSQQDMDKKGIAMEALSYLFEAYSQKRRRLGPIAVLHPLRATAMFSSAVEDISLVDVLSMLFHDVLEDISSKDFDDLKWRQMEAKIHSLFDHLDPEAEQTLLERLEKLTKRDRESYNHYIWRLLERSHDTLKRVQIKLADRVDNTLDMRIELQDPLDGVDFYEIIFQIMFVCDYQGYIPEMSHPPSTTINGAKRLFQLFKNVVLLSLIRKKDVIQDDKSTKLLFDTIAQASLKEAQRILIHLIGYHYTSVKEQRTLLLEAMDYCYSGKSCVITMPNSSLMIDGLFSNYFGVSSDELRDQQLDILYQNKPLMIEASIAFIVIFSSFLNDPFFYVRGISAQGTFPQQGGYA